MSKPLDHLDTLAHCGLGAVVTAVGTGFQLGAFALAQSEIALGPAVASASWMAALVIIGREVVQASSWCESEEHWPEEELAYDNAVPVVKPRKRYHAGRGLNFTQWGRQKHYETWVPAAVTMSWGTGLGMYITWV